MITIKTLQQYSAFVMLLLFPFLFSACNNGAAKPTAGPVGSAGHTSPKLYKVSAPYAGPATIYYSYPTTIQGEQDIDIRPKVDGFIDKIYVEEGAIVHKGQPLFRLKNLMYEASRRSALAAIRVAEANVLTDEMNLEKDRPLVDQKIISDYQLKADEYNLMSVRASLASAKADLITAQENLDYLFLTSPSDGVISAIPYKVGSLITSTSPSPLTTVYNTKKLYAYFSLNEKQLLVFLKMTKGKTLKDKLANMADVSLILADGTPYSQKGRIVSVSGLINTQTGSATFRADFPNALGVIRSGSSATIKIPVHLDTALLIPQNATYETQGNKFVFTVSKKDSTLATAVSVSENSIGDLFLVETGLKKGDKVVVEDVGNLKAGTAIKPVPSNSDSLYAAATKTPAQDLKATKPQKK
jgi:membrane fusion protein, multidrug efflux system